MQAHFRPQLARTPAEWTMLSSFGVFCFVFPFATFLLSFDLMPFGMEWMSSLLLAMLGVASGAWLWANFGRAGLILSIALFGAGVALEYIGVNTGLPFGAYRYTSVLTPGLPGGVPLAIGFAWLLIVVAGLFTARRLLWPLVGGRKGGVWLLCGAGALLAVGLDLLLEPVAYHVKGYWRWLDPQDGGYYGVPWSNFAAWLVFAFLMNGLVALLPGFRGQVRWGWLPMSLYAMNAFMFGVVNLAHGFWVAGAMALGLLMGLWVGLLQVVTRMTGGTQCE